jgi:hypothetical protein
MLGRRSASTRRPRPRAVWAALITSTIVCLLIVVGVLIPVLTLIGAADGGTAGALDVPVGRIVAAIAIGYVLALVLLGLVVTVRNGPLAWILGVAAVVSTLLVSLWPLVAVAIAGVDQVQDVVPFIQDLVRQYVPGA